MNNSDIIFALDVGTRTVIGVAGIEEEGKFKILASEMIEHKSRAMIDGQVHDIEEVAKVAGVVKESLEKKLDFKLERVAIAAAGRALKTKEIRIDIEVDPARELDKDTVAGLVMEGLQSAQREVNEELLEEDSAYYCVGHTVINYYLNNYTISSLIGHKGRTIGADILATFLPHTVVDSLYTVMDKIGLEVVSLTLEPIAAINAAIPKELRLLNLALVDIGAGTSDIAVTKNGSVVAYAMAPVAGDEITEMICQNYLLDFNSGEKVKLALGKDSKDIKFVDILGIKQSKNVNEIKELIGPAVKNLADIISDRILEYNKKAPNAVFLVGGGSQIPGLSKMIAENLGLPEERVAVRGSDAISNIKIKGKKLSGPDFVTPFGIALTFLQLRGQDFLPVTVNGKEVKLFNSGKLLVSDALMLAGFKPEELIPGRGKDLKFELNGESKIVKGEYGDPAQIFVNDLPSNLQTLLVSGDDIVVLKAGEGKISRITARDIIEYYSAGNVTVRVNGSCVPGDYSVIDGDKVEIIDTEEQEQEEKLKNTDEKSSSTEHSENSGISAEPTISSFLHIIVNGKELTINDNQGKHIFVDVFKYINFDLKNSKGNIALKLNGENAAYTDNIKNGDVIDIYWE